MTLPTSPSKLDPDQEGPGSSEPSKGYGVIVTSCILAVVTLMTPQLLQLQFERSFVPYLIIPTSAVISLVALVIELRSYLKARKSGLVGLSTWSQAGRLIKILSVIAGFGFGVWLFGMQYTLFAWLPIAILLNMPASRRKPIRVIGSVIVGVVSAAVITIVMVEFLNIRLPTGILF